MVDQTVCPRCGARDSFMKGFLPETCVCRVCQSQLDWREIPGCGPDCRPVAPEPPAPSPPPNYVTGKVTVVEAAGPAEIADGIDTGGEATAPEDASAEDAGTEAPAAETTAAATTASEDAGAAAEGSGSQEGENEERQRP